MTRTAAIAHRPLPTLVSAFGFSFLVLGALVAVAGFVFGGSSLYQGDHSVTALQNISSAIGGVIVGVYGLFILKRKRKALGRWWFLAAWAMNFLTPLGLFFLAFIIASTLTLRRKYADYFRDGVEISEAVVSGSR
jgi:hypothetical protein